MPFPPDAIHPPSFVEQLWLHHALWAFELYSYIYTAATTRWAWSPKKIGQYTGAFQIFPNEMNWHEDEHLTITPCMRCLSRRETFLLEDTDPVEIPRGENKTRTLTGKCRACLVHYEHRGTERYHTPVQGK